MASVEFSWPPVRLLQDGPWIQITIANPRLELEEAKAVGLEFPEPLAMKALIDTGASITVVNPQVAKTWKLRQTGFAKVVAVGGSGQYPEYAAAIEFPTAGLKGFDPIRIVACPIVQAPVSCLIGRDILQKWLFTYEGPASRVKIED